MTVDILVGTTVVSIFSTTQRTEQSVSGGPSYDFTTTLSWTPMIEDHAGFVSTCDDFVDYVSITEVP